MMYAKMANRIDYNVKYVDFMSTIHDGIADIRKRVSAVGMLD